MRSKRRRFSLVAPGIACTSIKAPAPSPLISKCPDGSNPGLGRIKSSLLTRSNPASGSPEPGLAASGPPGTGRVPLPRKFDLKPALPASKDAGMSTGIGPVALRNKALSYSIRFPMFETTVNASDTFRRTCLARVLVSSAAERNAPARNGWSSATALW